MYTHAQEHTQAYGTHINVDRHTHTRCTYTHSVHSCTQYTHVHKRAYTHESTHRIHTYTQVHTCTHIHSAQTCTSVFPNVCTHMHAQMHRYAQMHFPLAHEARGGLPAPEGGSSPRAQVSCGVSLLLQHPNQVTSSQHPHPHPGRFIQVLALLS